MTKNNKWLSVIVAFALCLPLYAWNGSGTYENPYEINTASDVADLVSAVNGGADQSGVYFLQTADIDLSTFGNFTPIGSASAPFAGNYDGDGYILSNLTITASVSGATTNCFGLFGYCQNATIENTITHGKIEISADYNANACVAVGGVVGLGKACIYASDENHADLSLILSNAPNNQDESGSIKYGVAGVVGIIRDNTNKNYYDLKNYGNIVFLGMDGVCCCSGVANFRVVYTGADSSSYGFARCKNYGDIVADGVSNAEARDGFCSGVLSVHYLNYGGGSRPALSYWCENHGNILTTGSVHTVGIHAQNGAAGSERWNCYYSTNYGNIRGVHSSSVASAYCGVGFGTTLYSLSYAVGCANRGNISVVGNGSGGVYVGGVIGFQERASRDNNAFYTFYDLSNFGDISVDCPSATAFVGGVFITENGVGLKNSYSYGNINVNAKYVRVGGVYQRVAYAGGGNRTIITSCFADGEIVANGDSGHIGGIIGSSPKESPYHTIISNCYSVATINAPTNFNVGSIIGEQASHAETYFAEINNCYGVGNYPMVGSIDTNTYGGSVSFSDCFNISKVATDFSSATTNNVASYTYEQFYRNPNSQAFLYNYAFTHSGRDTNSFYDLALPINKLLFPTITDEVKQKHNWTRLNGYKRYIRTIQQ